MLLTGEFLNMRQQLRHNTRTFRFICLVCGLIFMIGSQDLYAQLFQSEPMISGYRDFEFTGGSVTSEPTEEKPESKLWHNDGYWWAVLWDSDNEVFSIYRFDVSAQSWFRTGPGLDARGRSAQDVLWDESAQKLYVASRAKLTIQATQSHDARFYRLSYNSSTKTYSVDSGFPSVLGSTECRALVITKDSTGQLWATWTYNGKVMLNQSTNDGVTWGTPFVLPTQGGDLLTNATETLDISSICAFDVNKIGVLWGNQVDEKYYFSVHQDSNNDATWDAREIALELEIPHAADDHINLTVTNGTVLAALKTGVNGADNPLIELLKRSSNGTWTNHTVALRAYSHTRPIVLFDSDTDSVYVFAKSDLVNPFAIYYKVAHINNLTFPEGLGRVFIESVIDINVNNPSSTKQSVNSTTGLLVIASDKTTKKYVHNYLTLGGNVTPLAVDDNAVVPRNTATLIDVLQNDSDANGLLDPTSVALVTAPLNGSVQIDPVTGVISYTPNTDYLGSDSFQYTVKDDDGEGAIAATVNITVQVNTPPVANDDAVTLDEDTSVGIDVLANDSDSDGVLVAGNLTVLSTPVNGTIIDVNSVTGVVTYQPHSNFSGDDSFTYQVSDNSGGSSNVATVDVTVSPVNDGPLTSDDSAVTDEDTQVSIDVLSNDSDVEPGGTLNPASVTVTSGPDNGSTTVVTETGIVSYIPDPDFNGADSFTYTVQDNEGGTSNAATVTVTVTDINDAPDAVDDAASTSEEVPVDIDVTLNDTDVDGTFALNTVTIVAVPTNGIALVDGSNGVITYTPNENFFGTDTFQYTVNDDDNATSNAATVTVTISDLNDPPTVVDDAAITAEDTQKLINVLANDSDIEGSIVSSTLVVVSAPDKGGQAEVNSQSGLITYTPAANFSGEEIFQYTVKDDDGATSSPATVTVTVTEVNDAPEANNDARTINEDFVAPIDILANDVDIDGTLDPATVVIKSGPIIGSASVEFSTGVVTYTPPLDFVGTDVFSYEVKDDDGATSNPAVVTVTVSAANDPPQANDDTATTTEDTPVDINVLANDTDVDGAINAATLVVTIPGNGIAAAMSNGSVRYTPNADFNGQDSFTYTVKDNQGDVSNSATVTVTVLAQNDGPFAADDIAGTHEGQSVVIDVVGNDSDVDGNVEPGTVTVASQPSSGTAVVDGGTGAITYTPNAGFSGTDSFTYTVDDNSGLTSNPATVTINVNDLPVAVNDAALTSEQVPVVIDVLNNDSDSDGEINQTTVTIITFPGHGTTAVDPNDGKVTYTPVFNFFGTDTFTYTFQDNLGATSNTATVSITINGGPTAVSDSPVTDEDVPIEINILANDLDPDGSLDPATVTIVSNVTNGSTELNTTSGAVTYTPNAEFSGNDSFTYTVRDNLGEISNIATVSITINNVNDPPNAVDDIVSTGEDIPVDINVTSNDSDIDGTIDVSSVLIASQPTNGTAEVNASGVVKYTPNLDFFGIDTFTYTVNDVQGATSDPATVAVSVSGDNDSPTANNDAAATNENQAVVIDVLSNDTDLDGTIDSTTVATVTAPSHGVTAIHPTTGAITYTPVFGFSGSDSFAYRVNDNDGLTSNIATVTISINDLPVAVPDNAQTHENQPVDVAVIANDTDSDGAIDTSTVTVVIAPTQGSAVVNPETGVVSYTPNPGFSGSDTFWYTVQDNLGASSNQALVSVSINDLPVANNDPITTNEETQIAIDILANDTDSNGSLQPATVAILSQVTNGTMNVDPETAVVTYTPNAEFFGTDGFTYTVADNDGAVSNVATVTITVNPVNDLPNAVDDIAATGEDTQVIINVKVNDTDIDGTLDPTSVTIDSAPSNGSVSVDAVSGEVTYTPSLDFTGSDVFTYTIKDNEGGLSNIATVTVNVTNDNDAPHANADSVVIDEDVVTVIDILANDSDVDGTLNAASVTLFTDVTSGTLVDLLTGAVRYTPPANFFGTDTFTYTVNDNIGFTSNVATVTITINPINDAPLAVDDAASTNPNVAAEIDVTANDTDVDGSVNPSSILASAASNGTIAILQGGILRYTPFTNFIGTDLFTYTVKDNLGAVSNVATVTVSINNLPIANNDFVTTSEETQIAINVLANDTDPDGSIVPTSLAIQTPPANGTALLNTTPGEVIYTPNSNFSGVDTFTYTVQDDAGLTSTPATVTVTVNSVLDPPFAQNDNASTSENKSVTINVLANDTAIDGTIVPGTVTIATAPSNGIAIANPSTGQITYTPNNGFSGADVFTYTVDDNNGNTSNAATVTVAVSALPSTLTFQPTDDAYVHQGEPTRDHSDAADLRVRQTGSTDIDTYLKFNLTGLGGPPQSAILRLYVINDSNDGGTVFPASNNLLNSSTPWTEENITYPDRPATNAPLGSLGATTAIQYTEFDVTDAISGDGVYSFAISRAIGGNNDLASYNSKETANPPELVIETGGGAVNPPPSITSFSPASGPVGTVVTIAGSNLLSVTSATFNGMPATNVIPLSEFQVRATVPTGAATGKVSVSGPNGTALSATDFTVEQPAPQPPVISSFSPTSGPVNTPVTVLGSNFLGATQVTFNAKSAQYTVISNSQIHCTVPTDASTGPISVSNAHGTAVSGSFFTINTAPLISSFTPPSGVVGTTVVISGSNFTAATTVSFNGTAATSSFQSATQISAIVPGGATSGKISVSNSSGTAQSADNFVVNTNPNIASFSPTTGPVGTAVTILGTGLNGVTGVSFNGLAASGFSSISDSQLLATVPSGATTGPIGVTNPAGSATSLADFTVTTGGGGGQTLTFQPTDDAYVHQGNPDRNHGDHSVLRVRLSSSDIDSYFKFNLTGLGGPPQSATLRINVNDVNPSDGSSDGGTIYPASNNLLNSSTPWTEEELIWDNRPDFDGQNPLSSAGAVAVGEEVEFDVTSAIFGDGTYSFVISNQNSDLGVYKSKETASPPELVIVTSGGGSQPPPSITSFSPASGPVGTVVTIAGSNLLGVTSAAFNGTAATNVTVLSGAQVRATVPSGAATGKISVSGSNGTAFSATDFTVEQPAPQPPVITSFSPANGPVGTPVTISGSNFTGATNVRFNGTAASYTVTSDNQIQCTVPNGASTGTISVTSAHGAGVSAGAFTVNNAPVISSFTPASGLAGNTVEISGSNLTGATGVSFNGSTATFTVVSDIRIDAIVPNNATSGKISVSNSSDTAQSVDDFTVVSSPSITSFSPTTGPVGTAVTILGTGFTGVTGVTFNGLAASGFSSISDTQLLATVPSGATSGPISVTNPAGTAASSSSFTVTTGGGGGQTLTFQPTDDAYVHEGEPTRNHWDHPVLRVRQSSSDIDSYFKFNLTGLGGPPQSATLRIHVNDVNPSDGSSDGGTIYPASNNLLNSSTPWTEEELIWDNRPGFDGQNPLSSVGAVAPGEEVEFDVTNAIFGDGTYSFVISNQSSDLGVYQSKETANPPELVIVTSGGGSQPPPSITSFSPSSGPVGTVVTIAGSNLLGVTSAAFNGTPATNVTVVSDAQVRATVPSGASSGKISVSGSNGTGLSATNFTVQQSPPQLPVITSFTPTTGAPGTTVTIFGSGFTGVTGVAFNSLAAGFSSVSDSQLLATVPSGATTGPISVTNAAGTAASSGSFTVTTGGGGGQTLSFTPTDDAYISTAVQYLEKTYNGNTLRLRRTGGGKYVSYLKFNVTGVSGPVQSAVLRLSCEEGGTDGGSIYSVSNNRSDNGQPWTEATVTGANAPSPQNLDSEVPLNSVGTVGSLTDVDFDVSGAVNGNGVVSFAIQSTSSDAIKYTSTEGNDDPVLVITTGLTKAVAQEETNGHAEDDVAEAPEADPVLPEEIALHPNYPNPFNIETNIEYSLPSDANVKLGIFNLRGQLVRELVNDEQRAGFHKIQWNGRNGDDLEVATGVYLIRLEVGAHKFSQKITLQK